MRIQLVKRPSGRGMTLQRGDHDFDRQVLETSFNGRDPGRRPQVMVQANDVYEVIAAVRRAVRENLRISVCSGGHSWAQNHLREGGMLIDVGRLNSIEVNRSAQRAIVGPGCWSVDLDQRLKREGLFFPVAHAPDVCMGGFLLQGGFGWGGRKFGLGCQNVLGVDVVLADGQLVHASADDNADLYWAARGAGPGFFGVVVRYHLQLHARPRISAMMVQVFAMRHLEEVFRWNDEVAPDVARTVELQMLLTPKAMGIFRPGIEVLAPVLADSWKEAREAVAFLRDSRLRSKASFTSPLVPLSTALMSWGASVTHFPARMRWCADNAWLTAPVQDMLPALQQVADSLPPAPSHALWLNWYPPSNRPDMAFSMESNRYFACYGEWEDATGDAANERWATDCMRRFEPFAKGIQLADENLGQRPARFMADANLMRLERIRAQYDPEGRFHAWMGRPPLPEQEQSE